MLAHVENIEILLTFLGIRNPFKKKQTFKRLLYCFYTLFIKFLIIKRIANHSSNYSKYDNSHILNLVDWIFAYFNIGGLLIVYLESFFGQQELGLIKKEFKEVDRILLESFRSRISYNRTFEIGTTILTTLFTILIIVNGICVTIGRKNLHFGIISSLTYAVIIGFTFHLGLICYPLKEGLTSVQDFLSCSSEGINLTDYDNAGKLLQRYSRIIRLINKHFRIKFLYIIGEYYVYHNNICNPLKYRSYSLISF
jgi:hypothetical protein